MTTLIIITLVTAIFIVLLVIYLLCKRLYQIGYETASEDYQKVWHKKRLLLEAELRKYKKKHNKDALLHR